MKKTPSHTTTPKISLAIACFIGAGLFGYYLHLLKVSVDLKLLIPVAGSVTATLSGLWGITQYASNFLEEFKKEIESSQEELDGKVARLEARVQLVLEPSLSEAIANQILEEIGDKYEIHRVDHSKLLVGRGNKERKQITAERSN